MKKEPSRVADERWTASFEDAASLLEEAANVGCDDVDQDIKGQLKLLLAHLQIMGSLSAAFPLPWPKALLGMLSLSSIANIDFLDMFGVNCATPIDYGAQVRLAVFTPLVYVALLALSWKLQSRGLEDEDAKRSLLASHYNVFNVILFVVCKASILSTIILVS